MDSRRDLLLRLEWVDDLPVGSVRLSAGDGKPIAFRGWLELAAAVRVLGPPSSG
jgi:hypothetical protein